MKSNNLTNLIKTTNISFLVSCFRITLNSGRILAFTTSQKDIVFKDDPFVIYKRNAVENTAYSQSNTAQADNMDASIVIDNDDIKIEDLETGIYDNAQIQIFDFDLRLQKEYINTNPRSECYVGQVTRAVGLYKFELRGMIENLKSNTGKTVIPTCSNQFGDFDCGVDLTPYTFEGVITAVVNYSSFYVDIVKEDNYFTNGMCHFTSGQCAGIEVRMKRNDDGHIFLRRATVYSFKVGDTVKLIRGCDKTINTCVNDYDNAENFDGFPYLPGMDNLTSSE